MTIFIYKLFFPQNLDNRLFIYIIEEFNMYNEDIVKRKKMYNEADFS